VEYGNQQGVYRIIDPRLNMRKLEPQSQSQTPVERRLLLLLTCSFCIGTMLLFVYTPPVTTLAMFIAYTLILVGMRLFARVNGTVDRTATKGLTVESGQPMVSIIVPAHNEESVIASALKSLMQIDYANYELLVVDDRSTDGTAAELRRLRADGHHRFSCFTRQSGATPGKGAALNDAFKHTKGELIAIFDADTQVDADFLKKMIPLFADPLVGAAQGRKVLLNADQNFLTSCQQYEYCMDAYFQVRRDTIRSAVELRGNGMVLRRSMLEELGGLSEQSLCEDLDLSTRMHIAGWDIRYEPTATVREEGLSTVGALLRQRIRWTEASVIRYLENAQQILFNPKLAFRTKMDAGLFIFEFIGPVWLFLENILLMARWLTGHLTAPPLLFAAPAMTVLCSYFVYASFLGIYRFDKAGLRRSIQGTAMVYFYLSFLWLPIVFFLFFKILTRKERDLFWNKTPHYGVALK
jgi:1,2-diacylglycerol 3-beta-glucosyltransferase